MRSLCAACAAIDFSAALAVGPSEANRHGNDNGETYPYIILDANADRFDTSKIATLAEANGKPSINGHDLSSKAHATTSFDPSCPLCQILTLTLCPCESEWSEIAVQLEAAQDPYILQAYSFAHNCLWVPEDIPTVQDCHILLAVRGMESSNGNYSNFVSEEGYVVCLPKQLTDQDQGTVRERFYVPRVVGGQFDAERARHWISNCKECHEECKGDGDGNPVEGMRIIDVERRRVVPASKGIMWLALSYVWGDSKTSPIATSIEQDRVLGELPKTIEDTIEVTKLLGYRYLWIDRYCIDQSDVTTRQSQLDNMDSIYRSADLTIVAACGTDEDYGLPGVSTTVRKEQPVLELDSYTILSTGPDPIAEAKKSRWWSRGWTFQEALLSRRKLYFTDHQSFFECTCGCLMEALSFELPDASASLKRTSRRGLNLTKGFFTHATNRMERDASEIVAGADQYYWIAREYTKRNLTFDTDCLAAFAGLSTYLSNQEPKVQNLLGLPYVRPTSSDDTSDQLFAFSLCWFHSGDLTPRRRLQFPSWTWAGWAGKVQWLTGKLEDGAFTSKMRNVGLEKYEEAVSVHEYMRNFESGSAVDGSDLVLCFEARVVPPTLFLQKEEIDWGESEEDGDNESDEHESLPEINKGIGGQAFAISEQIEDLADASIEGRSVTPISDEDHQKDPLTTIQQSPIVSPEDIPLPLTPKLLPAPAPDLWSSYTVGPHSLYERSRNLDVSPLQFLQNIRSGHWSCLILGDYDGNAGYSYRRFMLIVEWNRSAENLDTRSGRDNTIKLKARSGEDISARRVGALVIKRQPYVDDHERDFFEDGELEWREVRLV